MWIFANTRRIIRDKCKRSISLAVLEMSRSKEDMGARGQARHGPRLGWILRFHIYFRIIRNQ